LNRNVEYLVERPDAGLSVNDLKANVRLKNMALAFCVLAVFALIVTMATPPFTQLTHGHTSMLAVHLLLELFAIIIAIHVVTVSWHTFEEKSARSANILIYGFVIVASCDLVHALTYDGMPPFLSESSTQRAIFFWLMGRTFEVATMWLLAINWVPPLSRRLSLMLGLFTAGLLIWFGSYSIEAFPLTFIQGQGVTPFKTFYEYSLCLIYITVAILLWRRANRSGQSRYYLLAVSCFVMGIGEISFTSYVSPSDFQNIFGHVYKLVAYTLLYWATFIVSIRAPFEAVRQSESRLRESELRLRSLSDNLPNCVVYQVMQDHDGSMRFMHVSEAVEQLNGLRTEDVLRDAMTLYSQVVAEDRPRLVLAERQSAERMEIFDESVRVRRNDGQLRWMQLCSAPRRLEDGRTIWDGVELDITERKQAEEAVRKNEARFRYMLETSPIAVRIAASSSHKVLFANQRYARMINSARDQVIGTDSKQFYANPQDYEDILQQLDKALSVTDKLIELNIPGARTTWALASYFRLEYENEQAILAWFYDVTDLKEAEDKIHQMAFHDALTQLPNRRLLMDRLNQALAASARNGQYGAVLFIDLDRFKNVNDTKGHDIGDLLLVDVAKRLESCVREGDTVSRLGGDEFLVVLETLSSDADEAATQAGMIAEKIRATLSEPYTLKERLCYTTPSIGIVLFRGHQEIPDDLLRYADTAMYQAKTSGRNAIRFYDSAMQLAIDARVKLDDELRLALDKQQFRLHYQIQVDHLRRSIGAEVLLRWAHPEHGLVSPAQFIPLAEETGLIIPIGLWVLQTACAQLAAWQNDALTRELTLAINVSAKQFHEADFVAQVQRALLESGAKPSLLKLELTESTMLENVEDTIIKMREIEKLGVSFSMDDFGTGYSSLQYLKRLPLSQIKIDQSFVRDIVSDPNDASIVQTIIAMTKTLGLNVIAEGVENEAQCQFLKLRGCQAFQGYLFSKPVPLDEFMVFLRNRN